MARKTNVFSIRLDGETYSTLKEISAENDKTPTTVAREAIENGMLSYRLDKAIGEQLDRWNGKGEWAPPLKKKRGELKLHLEENAKERMVLRLKAVLAELSESGVKVAFKRNKLVEGSWWE